jgi:hypothetical protein
MDFHRAALLLEGIADDLEGGALMDARDKLNEAIQLKMPPNATKPGESSKPMKIQFRSTLKDWKEHLENGGEDSPEALGGFLHRHFGDRSDFDHKKVREIAHKAHGVDKETARRVADHFIDLRGKGKLPPRTE